MARNSLKTNYEINAGTLFEGFQTIGEWTRGGAAGSISEDTNHYTYGTKSLTITYASGTAVFYDKTINQVVDGDSCSMLLKVYIPSLTNLTSIALYIASASNFSKYFSKTILGTALHEGYNYIPISPSEWSNTGSESWANTMVRLRIRVNASTGTPSCSFCSIHTKQYNKPKVLVTFDDSWDSQYLKGYAYMQPLGLKGTIYTIGSKLGTTKYCTLSQIREMYAAGWDIGNHGSVNLTTLATQALQEAEIAGEEAYISEFTRSKKHYAYPNGGYDANALAAMSSLGYLTARTIIDRQQANYIDERYLLTRYGVYNTTSVATAQGYIDRAIAQGSSILLNFHIIVDSDADIDTKVLTADFNSIIDYIYTKQQQGLLDVVTISEWYNELDGRRTSI
jgi:peptidoglycan/xylan/chitin deacetylase (PgdA/CDA1 family)